MQRTMAARAADTINKRTDAARLKKGGIFGLIGVLCGSFSMLGSFNPVGIACIMAFLGEGIQFYVTVLTVIAGFVLGNHTDFVADYSIAVLLCTLYGVIKDRQNKTVSVGAKALSAFVIFTVSGIIKGVIERDIMFVSILYALEGLVIFSLVYIFDRGILTIKAIDGKENIADDEGLSIIAIAAFSSAGAAFLYTGAIPLHIISTAYIFLTAGWIFGAGISAVAGILTGLALLSGGIINTNMFVVISVTSALSGVLRGMGKVFTAVGCLALFCALSYWLNVFEATEILGMASACILFIISAEKARKTFAAETVIKGGSYDGTRNYITERLTDCYKGIYALCESFLPTREGNRKAEKETGELVDKVACIACENCPSCETCWNNSFYNTYQTLLTLFAACEKKGQVDASDLPAVFRDYCIRQNEFTDAVNTTYSGHRERLIWKMRLAESRQIAGEQMKTVADMMKSLAEEINNRAGFKENLEKILFYAIRKISSETERVIVEEGETGEYQVTVLMKNCEGDRELYEEVTDTVSSILGRKMKRRVQEQDGVCKLSLCEKCNFKISAAAAMAIKDDEKISGDSYSFMELPKGGYMIALSDGMGSGKAAGEESRTVIELLEQFAESGLKMDTALKMINSVLVIGADEESFATLDMCYIDMYSGMAEFIKTGAAATFVIRDGKAKAIRSSSLPIGMLKYFDMDKSEYKLKKNDIILMLTDGAAEVIDRDGMSDMILTELMENNKMKDPKDIADYVLESLKERSGFRIQDDMTVVAARVWTDCR
ncbi:MAG: SpoIIE family protein phosphatase [Clostridiales bacterium]|nr:SpoIIE family protein phosphatase [Clostridiales bacterium]